MVSFQGAEPDTRVPLSGVAHLLLPQLALAFLVALNIPRTAKITLSVPLLGYVVHTAATTTSGNSVDDYTIGCGPHAAAFFCVFFLVWFNDPMRNFRYLSDEDASPLSSGPIWSRIYASLCLPYSSRLIGWNVQVRLTARIEIICQLLTATSF